MYGGGGVLGFLLPISSPLSYYPPPPPLSIWACFSSLLIQFPSVARAPESGGKKKKHGYMGRTLSLGRPTVPGLHHAEKGYRLYCTSNKETSEKILTLHSHQLLTVWCKNNSFLLVSRQHGGRSILSFFPSLATHVKASSTEDDDGAPFLRNIGGQHLLHTRVCLSVCAWSNE